MTAPTSVEGYRQSWLRSLKAENKSPRTIETYSLAVVQLIEYLDLHDGPDEVLEIERRHVEGFSRSRPGHPFACNCSAEVRLVAELLSVACRRG